MVPEKFNALLDDASTKTYINSDVAAELGLQGQLQRVNVSVLMVTLRHLRHLQLNVPLKAWMESQN